jgi:Acetyl-CoA acetyltransferase
MGDRIVIVGAAETARIGVVPDMSALEMHAEAGLAAIADAGLTLADIDGLATAGHTPVDVAHYIGIQPEYMDGTSIGGCSYLSHVRHAAAAIAAGLCTCVLITHGESGRSKLGTPARTVDPMSPEGQFETPFGTLGAVTRFPIGVLRYMKDVGLTPEQLAAVPVAQRRWANGVPRARYRDLITVNDVLSSAYTAYPLHLLECCVVTDGGGALVVMAADDPRARNAPKPNVAVLGAGEAAGSPLVSQLPDFTESGVFRESARRAFAQAGVSAKDADHVMIYDAFAHLPLYGLEELGFVERGEAGAFVAAGETSPGGTLPLNTNGGGLSYTHTGMYGMFLIQESVRQLRGEADNQVPDATVSVCQGVGGAFMSGATLVLAREQ